MRYSGECFFGPFFISYEKEVTEDEVFWDWEAFVDKDDHKPVFDGSGSSETDDITELYYIILNTVTDWWGRR